MVRIVWFDHSKTVVDHNTYSSIFIDLFKQCQPRISNLIFILPGSEVGRISGIRGHFGEPSRNFSQRLRPTGCRVGHHRNVVSLIPEILGKRDSSIDGSFSRRHWHVWSVCHQCSPFHNCFLNKSYFPIHRTNFSSKTFFVNFIFSSFRRKRSMQILSLPFVRQFRLQALGNLWVLLPFHYRVPRNRRK